MVSTGYLAVNLCLCLSLGPLTVPRRGSASPVTPVSAEGHASGGGDDSLVDAQIGSCVLEIMTTVNVERHSVLHQEHADGFE